MCRATCGEKSSFGSKKRKSEPALVVVTVDQDFDNSFTVKVYSFHGNACTACLFYQGRNNLCAKMEDEKEMSQHPFVM